MSGFTYPSSQRRSKASCNSERSASLTSSSLCSCRGVVVCGDPLVSLLVGIQCRKQIRLGRNLAPAYTKTHTAKLQVLVHCPVVQVFCSQVSTTVISTNWRVSINHEALQPKRRGCDASSTSSHCIGSPSRCVKFDFKAGTVDSIT